jgi:hypothetical protein
MIPYQGFFQNCYGYLCILGAETHRVSQGGELIPIVNSQLSM